MFREAILAFIGIEIPKQQKTLTKKEQGIGEYCKGKNIEKCKKNFGDALKQACATCPD